MNRAFIALGLSFISTAASASPIINEGLGWDFNIGYYVFDSAGIGTDFITHSDTTSGGGQIVYPSGNGVAVATASGSGYKDLLNADDTSTIYATFNLVASASVSGGLGDITAIAAASVWSFNGYVTLGEDAIYSGPATLMDYSGTFYGADSVLAAGMYWFAPYFHPDISVSTGSLSSGESSTVSKSETVAFQFTAVPAPTAAPLIVLGLFAIVWIRRRAAKAN